MPPEQPSSPAPRRPRWVLGAAAAIGVVGALAGVAWHRQAEAQSATECATRIKKQREAHIRCSFNCSNQFTRCYTNPTLPECVNYDLKERACVEACQAGAAR